MISLKLWRAKRLHNLLLAREGKMKYREIQWRNAHLNVMVTRIELNEALKGLSKKEFIQFGQDTGYLEPKTKPPTRCY